MAINNIKPLTAIERIPYLDHDKLVKQINQLNELKDPIETILVEEEDLTEASIETLGLIHDIYHEVMGTIANS
ncbi:hypothetical protein LCGC14_0175290 [marine sediment metagenome]|uniref:Uncharacterized protein n=1 Tax=marine sediment metagenome TaxID=412755 RepID=A0A0F9UR89_9ZZZZ